MADRLFVQFLCQGCARCSSPCCSITVAKILFLTYLLVTCCVWSVLWHCADCGVDWAGVMGMCKYLRVGKFNIVIVAFLGGACEVSSSERWKDNLLPFVGLSFVGSPGCFPSISFTSYDGCDREYVPTRTMYGTLPTIWGIRPSDRSICGPGGSRRFLSQTKVTY